MILLGCGLGFRVQESGFRIKVSRTDMGAILRFPTGFSTHVSATAQAVSTKQRRRFIVQKTLKKGTRPPPPPPPPPPRTLPNPKMCGKRGTLDMRRTQKCGLTNGTRTSYYYYYYYFFLLLLLLLVLRLLLFF